MAEAGEGIDISKTEGDQTMSGSERELRMDNELLLALKKGDAVTVERFFSHAAVSSEAEEGRRSWRGVTVVGDSALHIVAAFGDLELAKLICDMDRSLLTARNAAGETPLHCATRAGQDRIVLLFISEARRCEEAVLRATDREGKTALHVAVEGGRVVVARVLVSADPGLAAIVDDNGVSPLYAAVLSKSLELVQVLIESRADGGDRPEASYAGPKGQTALHAAAMIESPEIAEKLLQWKPTITEKADDSGSTPLHYLATTFKTNMVRQLLKYNPSLAYRSDFEGLYPIHVAARMGRLSIIRELIKSCPDIYGSVDNKRRNFLHIAVEYERAVIVKFVCHGPLLVTMMNARDCEGNTPLHLAVKSKSRTIVAFLLANRSVHPSIVNKDGQTPLDLTITWLDQDSILQNLITHNWIYHGLKGVGAISGPRRLDHLIDKNITELDHEKEQKKYKDASQNLLVASVLIATVTFTAAFAMPGGFIEDDHRHGGSPTLGGKYAFNAFIAADTLAFIYSVAATIEVLYVGSQAVDPFRWVESIVSIRDFIAIAAQLMVVAFAMSVYVLLAPLSKFIAIFCCTVPLLFTLTFPSWAEWDIFLLAKVLMRRLGWSGLCEFYVAMWPAGLGIGKYKRIIVSPTVLYGSLYISMFILPQFDALGRRYCNLPEHPSKCSFFYG